jgi:4-diphosphocytidyl-2-C-methyl-D-erythritol kinase
MRFFSPAKLNLCFHILGKRSDGYHEIATLMQAIDLGDWLSVQSSVADRLTCSDRALSCDETNLVWKARDLFRAYTSLPPVWIHLDKRIPMQAGFGGGSSNAATALWALNRFMRNPLSLQELSSLGAELGSDVPFFFSLGSALCTGRGDQVQSLSLPPFSGMWAKPSFGLSTAAVYQAVRLEECQRISLTTMILQWRCGEFRIFNDLETAACRIEPKLSAFKQTLPIPVSMTGSGTAFFYIYSQSDRMGTKPFHRNKKFTFQSISRQNNCWYIPLPPEKHPRGLN